jgi:hypothetical protein
MEASAGKPAHLQIMAHFTFVALDFDLDGARGKLALEFYAPTAKATLQQALAGGSSSDSASNCTLQRYLHSNSSTNNRWEACGSIQFRELK